MINKPNSQDPAETNHNKEAKPNSADQARHVVGAVALTGVNSERHAPSASPSMNFQLLDEFRPRGLRPGAVAAEGSGMEHEQLIAQGLEVSQRLLGIIDRSERQKFFRQDIDRSHGSEIVYLYREILENKATQTAINAELTFKKFLLPGEEISDQISIAEAIRAVAPKRAIGNRGSYGAPLRAEFTVSADFMDDEYAWYDDYEHRFQDTSSEDRSIGDFSLSMNDKMRTKLTGYFKGEGHLGFGAMTKFSRILDDAQIADPVSK